MLLTFGVYLLQLLTQPANPSFRGDSGWLTNYGSLHADVLRRPWLIFEFLTYGFLHAPEDIKHILFNMIGLWFFGRAIEQRYGRSEYLSFYLLAIVVAGCGWYLAEWLTHGLQADHASMLGASGGLSAILILFA